MLERREMIYLKFTQDKTQIQVVDEEGKVLFLPSPRMPVEECPHCGSQRQSFSIKTPSVKEQRRGILFLNHRLLDRICENGDRLPLPDDLIVVEVYNNWRMMSVCVAAYHPSFDPVPQNAESLSYYPIYNRNDDGTFVFCGWDT